MPLLHPYFQITCLTVTHKTIQSIGFMLSMQSVPAILLWPCNNLFLVCPQGWFIWHSPASQDAINGQTAYLVDVEGSKHFQETHVILGRMCKLTKQHWIEPGSWAEAAALLVARSCCLFLKWKQVTLILKDHIRKVLGAAPSQSLITGDGEVPSELVQSHQFAIAALIKLLELFLRTLNVMLKKLIWIQLHRWF